jgi:hypothetical protein
VPFVAGFPFFSFVLTGFLTSTDFLHFTQYALTLSGVDSTFCVHSQGIIKKHRENKHYLLSILPQSQLKISDAGGMKHPSL